MKFFLEERNSDVTPLSLVYIMKEDLFILGDLFISFSS